MKGTKLFIVGIAAGVIFASGINKTQSALENFLIDQIYVAPKTFLAQASQIQPIKKEETNDFSVKAKAALVVKINDNEQKIVFDQNSNAKTLIASLTKLMTAVVSLDQESLSDKIEITKEMILSEWSSGSLKVGEIITTRELLKMALVESNNDAANALAQAYGRQEFIDLMNLKAAEIGLRSTYFSTPTGLEVENNFSSARDIAKLAIFILREYPLIFDISSQSSIIVLSENGELHHRAFNTNELLNSFESVQGKIVGGKTGYTDEAGGCILLVIKDNQDDYFINVILGADSREARFEQMRKLIQAFN